MSVYQPIAVSALEICVAVGSSTDTKLMKLALYAVDETALLLNSSQVGPVPPEFLALLEAYERILDDIRRHIENAQISTNKRENLFSRHMSSSRLKNELKNQLKTMLHGGQLAPPTSRENTVEILSVSLRASAVICEAPPLNFLKPIVGLAALICETAKTVKSNRDAAEELAKRAISVTNCVVERASKTEIFLDTNEDALNGLKGALEDVHSYLMFLEKRRRAMSWLLTTQEKDRVAQLNAGLDRALSLFMTTCVLSSNECLRSSNELVRSNTIQLDLLASTVKQLDGGMSQNFAVRVGWFGEDSLGCTRPSRYGIARSASCPPDGVALAEAYRRLKSESDGADGKEALERFVEARTALVAEAERLAEDCTWTTDARVAKHLIAASHAPADVTEGSYSIMDSPYLDISGRSATTKPSRTSSPSCTPRTPTAWCVGVLAAGVHAAGMALVDDELAREKAEELAGGGADAEVDVGEAGAQEQHVAGRDPGSTSARGSWKTRIRRGAVRMGNAAVDADAGGRGGGCPAGASGVHGAGTGGVRGGGGGGGGGDGADVAGGRAACGGGGKGCGSGACGGRECAADVRRRERADVVHENRAWARFKGGGAGGTRTRSRARCRTSTLCPSPALLSEEGPVAEYRCAHCVDVVRLFSMRALERHKCDKHGRARRTGRGWSGSRVEHVSRRSAVEPTPTLNPLLE
ncbi:hypothetical protein C8J57DRAFT_1472997 [Mycena rebaudengoi]|nr:hypothetical protein C8J57DRAFT_1472997 [Mycena rebaudengoi]